jgi:hypothetical protein
VSGPGDGADPLYFFVHLQKTAGTALFRRLRNHFGVEAVYPMPRYQGTPETSLDVDLLRQRLARHAEEVRVVTGHFPLCVADLLDRPVATFTLLREPVERTLSFLRHQREVEPRFAGAPLERIYDDPVCREGLVRNHMVRMLSLRADEMTEGALTPISFDERRLEAARTNLAERIAVMGIQEDFDAFCDLLSATWGWDLGPPQFANRTAPADASAGLRERIAGDNALDVELYRFAVDLWSRRRPSS